MQNTQRKSMLESAFIERFGAPPTLFVQAPGRVDLMGSHTDYNLGYVLTQALDLNVWLALRPRPDAVLRVCSLDIEGCGEFDLQNVSYNQAIPWTNYMGGVAAILRQEGYDLKGFDALVQSTVPIGSGLSSSAAMEVATAVAFDQISGLALPPVEMAKICQRAENEFVGMNCGILDQYSSAMGVANSTILLDCRSVTHEIKPIAPGVQVMICDTRAKRELTGSEYPERRAQCEQGARILNGFYPEIQSLRDVTLEQLVAHQADMTHLVYKRCKFIIEENQRVLDMAAALETGDHVQAGRLALESFAGARDLYEIVSSEMIAMHDAIVSAPGVFGARGAGAGFGGCLVAFIQDGMQESFACHVYSDYSIQTGIEPEIYQARAAAGAGVLAE
ncbi:MAG: galactokinase [Chloroflexi bacterium]|jgi:galactokinase|nr:galactokinase [Chloroflexota bacterium]